MFFSIPYIHALRILFRSGGMAQLVECLPSKHKALSSNACTAKICIYIYIYVDVFIKYVQRLVFKTVRKTPSPSYFQIFVSTL
jgi:hypothetical protein